MPETNPEANFLDVKIMGREYRVACMPEERSALRSAVDLVDDRMREVAQRSKSTIAERVAVMAALHIAHERLSENAISIVSGETAVDTSDARRRIEAMGARIDTVLAPQSDI
ncbi:MAG: cell division protein ZapA [Betaproteobacteria bacterium]|nr:cell division protein ZapA [Betaproteobacteria bacterium]MCL2885576.1 cell division protein ZapA [Betaproteobacteria bacterium]